MSAPDSPSVIIADNNEFHRRVLGDFYRECRFDVRVACDGIEALEMIKQRRPDLLVLDLIMPRFDGARLAAFLKGQDDYRSIPIIILSGILVDEIEGVEEIQADAYIAKMPLEQIGGTLREVSEKLIGGRGDASPILSGFEKMFRREVVLELLEERRSSQLTLDSLSEGIVEVSPDRRLLICNQAFETMAGAPSSEMLARSLQEVFPESRAILDAVFDEVERGIPVASALIRRAGRDLQIKLHRLEGDAQDPGGAPSGPHSQDTRGGVRTAVRRAARTEPKVQLETMFRSVGYTMLVEDVTQRTRMEREREVLRGRLAQSEKMSAIGEFVAGAAHELNNPLTSVLGYAQLLMQKHPDDALRSDLQKIAAGAGRCKTILENLMAFARSNRPAKVPMDLNTLLQEALAPQRERLSKAGIDVSLSLGDLPQTLADPSQIVQSFFGIIDNACKAMAGQPGPRRLTIASSSSGGRIRFQFDDTGPGIPEEALGRIFEPFFTTRQVGQGTGLGLSVAYGMVTSHGGRIDARNRPDGGASVLIDLPVATHDAGFSVGAASVQEGAAAPVAPVAAGQRILIVDDEPVVLELLVDILEGERRRIDTASNGFEGLRKIDDHDYDLIILDLRMPDMTGQQMYEELERIRPDLLDRMMFMTADTLTPDVDVFLKRVGKPCLTKPFAVDAVVESVGSILGTRGPARR